MIDPDVWRDQAEFNLSLRPDVSGYTDAHRIELTKDFALHMQSEIVEMLNAMGTWATHRRRTPVLINEENVRRQLIDQMKYWITICQLWGFTTEQMEETYWRKSATVRARHAEEFLTNLNRPAIILDLDNVLVDYSSGFSKWVIDHIGLIDLRDDKTGDVLSRNNIEERMQAMDRAKEFFSAEKAGIELLDWMRLQHAFRVGGGFGRLPGMPGLKEFVQWVNSQSWVVIGLTSRGIDVYPNIIDDTLFWIERHELRMDCVWWGAHKGEKLRESFPDINLVEFVVDDDPRYLSQYVALGVRRIYWMKQGYGSLSVPVEYHPSIITVTTLDEIVALEKERA